MRLAFELPVVVRSRYGRYSVDRTVLASVPHVREVPDLSEDDAPVAIAFEQPRPKTPKTLERVVYRFHEGALWTDVGAAADHGGVERLVLSRGRTCGSPFFGGPGGVAARMAAILAKAADAKRPPSQLLAPNSLVAHVVEKGEGYALEPLVGLRLLSEVDGQVSRQIDAFDELLDEFVVIGTRLHRREPEPLARLYPDGRGLSAYFERRGYAEKPIPVVGHIPRSVGWFRMDGIQEMRSEAEIILSRMGFLGTLNAKSMSVEVHEKDVLSASPEALGVYDVADALRRHFQEFLASGNPGDMPGDAMTRWLAKSTGRDVKFFKAMAGRVRGDPDSEELTPDLEEAFMTMAEAEPEEFSSYTGSGHLRIFLQEVARRWRDRPLSLDIGR